MSAANGWSSIRIIKIGYTNACSRVCFSGSCMLDRLVTQIEPPPEYLEEQKSRAFHDFLDSP